MMSDLHPFPHFMIVQRNKLNALCFFTPIAL